jgi:hypothetical protein
MLYIVIEEVWSLWTKDAEPQLLSSSPPMGGGDKATAEKLAEELAGKFGMTWCSEDSATPRFVLASSAIRCRFVDRFVRLRVLSRDWDRSRARPAVGEGFPFLLFRLQEGFTVPPWLTFPEAPL